MSDLDLQQHLPLSPANLPFIEGLYEEYLRNPDAVSPEWRHQFEHWNNGQRAPLRLAPAFKPLSIFNAPGRNGGPHATGALGTQEARSLQLQSHVDQLIRNYRVRGHIMAGLDPLGSRRPRPRELELDYYGLSEDDLDRPFATDMIAGRRVRTLREILALLYNTYCRFIGAQFMHIDDHEVRDWLQQRMEQSENHLVLSRKEQLRIFTRLTDATIFEQFIQKKYLGAKTFSLEGAESLIPLLDLAIEKAGDTGVIEIVLGMAHRGRLNVLANIMNKSPQRIFREFDDVDPHLHVGRGDVKYHLGYGSDWVTSAGNKVHLSLCFNPSHLEFVNPVALGRMRAKMDRGGDRAHERGLVVLIHGDAAFVGEGVVQESLNLSELPAYGVGGTLHIVVNNQIGFTTPPEEGRSSTYATAIAKMLHIPIFHVNGENPEAVAQVVNLALDYRREFHKDVVIDMYCYRRRGHNESDEPSFTQPLMYKRIEQLPSVRDAYLEHLLRLGGVTRDEADQIAEERRQKLERELSIARSDEFRFVSAGPRDIWAGYIGGREHDVPESDTGVPQPRLAEFLQSQTVLPDGFTPHPKIAKFLEERAEMAAGRKPLNWAAGEALAFASLAVANVRIRMTGQDSERGTFSQRHAVLHDHVTGEKYTPLQHLQPRQAPVQIYNSALSEIAVLGFEYGYSLDCPEGLTLWEAQFGDFVNVAQVIIDQFICSAEDKWRRLSGLVLLLPHGFEGQGPEHSSARPERFLSLAAGDNVQVVYPTTPAQYFHVLRRQALRMWRKPLIVMTPKSLLRNPAAVSSLADCATGRFQRVIPDAGVDPQRTRRVLLTSGKIYYELQKRRIDLKRDDVAIVRVEQYYPLPTEPLRAALSPFAEGTPVAWVQEEPENMGAWRFLRIMYGARLLDRHPWTCVSRPAAASPATGSASSHKLEQEDILARAFNE